MGYVFILESGYDLPTVVGLYETEQEALAAFYKTCYGEDFSPDGDWETLEDWYMGCDNGFVVPFSKKEDLILLPKEAEKR